MTNINQISQLYAKPNVPGEFLVRPLKTWHQFLAEKIEKGSKPSSLAWRVGYLADIILGPLALMGLLFKGYYYRTQMHNEKEIEYIEKLGKELGINSRFVDPLKILRDEEGKLILINL